MAEIGFCLLGPLTVRVNGTFVAIPQGRQRAVLAVLLLNGNRLVSADQLAEALWGKEPPPSASVTVRNYVMRLRRTLGEIGTSRILTQPPGYLMTVAAGELDVSAFATLLDSAKREARSGSWEAAARQAAAALALWRGEPLADVDSEVLTLREVPALAEMRLQAAETRLEADLRLGRPGEVIAPLSRLVATHPLREHLHALLMQALYDSGRQADALAAYRHAREVLIDEIGAEPGAELREAHQRILAAAPGSAAPDLAQVEAVSPRPVVPRELPGTVRHFTGREAEQAALTALIERTQDNPPGMAVISAIGGTAGVGKTALAVHWAHQVADRFPDGQLYVNLRGYDPGQPMLAADALAGFLGALGVSGQDIPVEDDQRAARYRSLLAGRRMLVVLDNAGSPEQVRPLLPGTPGCVTLVTSRDSLAGLAVRDGAVRLDLDVLSLAEAHRLLRALLGPRVDAEPDAAAQLAEQCCRLPLALRVAAELAIARPAASLAQLAAELAELQRRLDLLEAGADSRTAVRTVFSWSCQRLDDDVVRAFRLLGLGLHPGADLDSYAAAALTGTDLDQAERLLGLLARAYLIQSAAPGRYVMHDLLRAYARELAAAQDANERRSALDRLFGYYLHTAGIATNILFPADRHLRPDVTAIAGPAPLFADAGAARAWLDTEQANLVAMTAHAAGHGWSGHVTDLSAVLFRYLNDAGRYSEALIVHGRALEVARSDHDAQTEANALRSLGDTELAQGRHPPATRYLRQALVLFRQAGDQIGEARALCNIGLIDLNEGHFEQAARRFEESLVLHREAGELFGQSRAVGNLGAAKRHLGRIEEAAGHYREALALAREVGDPSGQAQSLCRLGTLNLEQGRHDLAADLLRQALSLFRQIHEEPGVATAQLRLGQLSMRQKAYRQAADQFQQSLRVFREVGDRPGEATVLNSLGDVCLLDGQLIPAHRWYVAGLELATQIGMRLEQAQAHHGLARGYRATGDVGLARRHWQDALAIFTDMGVPQADAVRAELTATPSARVT